MVLITCMPSDVFVMVEIHQHSLRFECCLFISPMTHILQFSASNGLYTYRKWPHHTCSCQLPEPSRTCPFPCAYLTMNQDIIYLLTNYM